MDFTENERFKILQKELGYKSQQQFADALGVTQAAISGIYNKAKGIGVSSAIKKKLSEMGVNIDWLVSGTGSVFKDSPISGYTVIGGGVQNNLHLTGHEKIIGEKGDVRIEPAQPRDAAEILAEIDMLRRENAELKQENAELKGANLSLEKTTEKLFKLLGNK